MKKLIEYRRWIYVLLLALAFVAIDMWLVGKEIVIQSPIMVREKFLSPVDEQWIKEEQIKRKLLEEVKKDFINELEEVDQTSLAVPGEVKAQESMDCYGWGKYWALKYGVSVDLIKCVIDNESHGDPLAVGDGGKAVGCFQFWPKTWEWFRGMMELSIDDLRTNNKEASRTAVWAISKGYGSHWSPIKDRRCK